MTSIMALIMILIIISVISSIIISIIVSLKVLQALSVVQYKGNRGFMSFLNVTYVPLCVRNDDASKRSGEVFLSHQIRRIKAAKVREREGEVRRG